MDVTTLKDYRMLSPEYPVKPDDDQVHEYRTSSIMSGAVSFYLSCRAQVFNVGTDLGAYRSKTTFKEVRAKQESTDSVHTSMIFMVVMFMPNLLAPKGSY